MLVGNSIFPSGDIPSSGSFRGRRFWKRLLASAVLLAATIAGLLLLAAQLDLFSTGR